MCAMELSICMKMKMYGDGKYVYKVDCGLWQRA